MRRYLKLRREDMIRIIRSRTRRIWLHRYPVRRRCIQNGAANHAGQRSSNVSSVPASLRTNDNPDDIIISKRKTSAQANPELDR
ncbi:hypothetical protein LENED_000436 [Lentinula edodes]|uniref:Uncharacterized protein n=1 Tax=Lentinula edodes TaxID=5353 RepID=A0A1Q3DVN2_LENED|nr:hypothetical protein LENED_000436 [Lentinula edodes]